MGTRKNSDQPGHGARWPAKKAKDKTLSRKRITSGSADESLITTQVAKIAAEIRVEEVRSERIKFIKRLLKSNAYTIDPDEIARKMLEEV